MGKTIKTLLVGPMKQSTCLLIVSWIPVLQALILVELDDFSLPLSFILALPGTWLLYRGIPWETKRPGRLNYISLFVSFLILFVTPGIYSFSEYLGFDSLHIPHQPYYLPTMACVFSALLASFAMFWASREVGKGEKPYVPVLKFLWASILMLWQLNLGLHLVYDRSFLIFGGYGVQEPHGFLSAIHTAQSTFFLLFLAVNLVFFAALFIKRKFKGNPALFFAGTGLTLIAGALALLVLLVLLTMLVSRDGQFVYEEYYRFTFIPLSFATSLGPLLLLGLLSTLLGGVLSIFAKGARRWKALVLSTLAIVFYLAVFQSVWPLKDPSINISFSVGKKARLRELRNTRPVYIAFLAEFRMYGNRAFIPLLNKLKQEDPAGRRLSAFLLGYFEEKRAVEPLIEALEDSDQGVRGEAAIALAYLKDPRAIAPLAQALETEKLHLDTAESVLFDIGAWGDRRFVEPLLRMLDKEDEDFKYALLSNLDMFKDPRIVDELVDRIGKPAEKGLTSEYIKALGEITGVSYKGKESEAPAWWRQWWQKNRARFIAENPPNN